MISSVAGSSGCVQRRGVTWPAFWILAAFLPALSAQSIITTFAGTEWIFPNDGRPALNAPLGRVTAVASDRESRILFTDQTSNMVMRVDRAGKLEVVAGNGIQAFSGDQGPATSASLWFPSGVAADAQGNIYIADAFNFRIRKVTADGIISTIGGTGRRPSAIRDSGPAASIDLGLPLFMAVDSAQNIYFFESDTRRVRRISPAGLLSTFAGGGPGCAVGPPAASCEISSQRHRDNTPATSLCLADVSGLAIDASGSLYIADQGTRQVIRIVQGNTHVVAGGGTLGQFGSNVPATSVDLANPSGITFDRQNAVYIAEAGNTRIRRIRNGTIDTYAGDTTGGYRDAAGAEARFRLPAGITSDIDGNLFVADIENFRVRRISATAQVTTVAGSGTPYDLADGAPARTAILNLPNGLGVDRSGDIWIGDTANSLVRKVSGGNIFTGAGNGVQQGQGGEGTRATSTPIIGPRNVVFDSANNMYFSDSEDQVVRKVSPQGFINTVAGIPARCGVGADNVPGRESLLRQPGELAIDDTNNLYIVEYGNHRVRKLAPNGIISTVLGSATGAASCQQTQKPPNVLCYPYGIAIDRNRNIYVSDSGNARVLRIDSSSSVSTVAGGGSLSPVGRDTVPATQAALRTPEGLAVESSGNLLFTDLGLNVLLRLSGGMLSVVAGSGRVGLGGDGGLATQALLRNPVGVTADSQGNIYLADTFNNRVRVIQQIPPSFTAAPNTLDFTAKNRGASPVPQTIALSGSTIGLRYTIAPTSDTPWLSVSSTEGVMPDSPEVLVDPKGLAAGNYTATLRVTSPGASPAQRTVTVRLTVEAPLPPRLVITRSSLNASMQKGDVPVTATAFVENRGGGELAFTVTPSTTDGNPWLQVAVEDAPALPDAPATLIVTFDPQTLAPETYSGSIQVRSSSTEESVTIPVTLALSDIPRPRILLSQPSLRFVGVAQGGSPLPQTLAVLNPGKKAMNFEVTAEILSGGDGWLKLDGARGAVSPNQDNPPNVQVSVTPANLEPGHYAALLHVVDRDGVASNSPQEVSVYLSVLPPGQDPGPDISPTGLIFTGPKGALPGSQSVDIANVAGDAISYTSTSNLPAGSDWLTIAPDKGAIGRSEKRQLLLQPKLTDLSPGAHRSKVTLSFTGGVTREVNVLTYVVDEAANSTARNAVRAAGSIDQDAFVQVDSPNSTTAYPVNSPINFKLSVAKLADCNGSINFNDSLVYARFTGGAEYRLSGTMRPDGGTTWTSSGLPPKLTEARLEFYKVKINNGNCLATPKPTPALTVRLVQPNPPQQEPPVPDPPPTPIRTAIVNSATYEAQPLVAPGSLVTIFGTDLASARADAVDMQKLPRALGGTRVTLAGSPLALLYVSPDQVNAVVPYGLTPDDEQSLVVVRDAMPSIPAPLSVARTRPGIFLPEKNNTRQGSVYYGTDDQGAPRLVTEANPAPRGQEILIYCAGLGETESPVEAGVVPGSPVRVKVLPIVTIGDKSATVRSATLSSTAAGRYEVRVVVPADIATGTQIPLTLTVGAQTSPPVYIQVR